MYTADGQLAEHSEAFSIFESVHDSVLIADFSHHITSHNRHAMELLGAHDGELIGMQLEDVIHAQDRGSLTALFDQAGRSSTPTEIAASVKTRTGVSLPVTLSVAQYRTGPENAYVLICVKDLSVSKSGRREMSNLEAIFDHVPSPVLRIGREGTIIYANAASWILLEYWAVEVGGLLPTEWQQKVQLMFERGETTELTAQIGFKVVQLIGIPMQGMDCVNLYGVDVTQRRRIEEKLAMNAQVVENASEGVMITDGDLRVLEINRAFTEITGLEPAEILGESAVPLLSGTESGVFDKVWSEVMHSGKWQGELWDRRKNGESYPKWLSITSVKDGSGNAVNFTVIFADVSKIKEAEENLYQLAHYDSLTGLANRRSFKDRLEEALVAARRTETKLGLMFVDLDSFKHVNDHLGHAAGDELLCTVARRIRAAVRESDAVARIGGDEFTVILPGLHTSTDVVPIAEKILNQVKGPCIIGGQDLAMSASVGIAIFPDDGKDADTLLLDADTAMYRAKETGKNDYQFFSPEMNSHARERLTLRARLRRAVECAELSVHFQPQVDAVNGRFVAAEALARWFDSEGHMVNPAIFIPLAEESGLIHDLGELVFRKVCEQWVSWSSSGILPPRLAVNISVAQLRGRDFPKRFQDIFDRTGVPPQAIEFELTESMFIDDSSDIMRKLNELREGGATLAIDDFGTRYSSLSYLKRLPIDRIKIDKSFVNDVPHDKRSGEIAGAIVAMGRSMHLEVVAEGVEKVAQLLFLREQGCHLIQGHLLRMACAPEDLEADLRAGVIPMEVKR